MTKPPQSAVAEELLQGVVDYLVEHGVSDASLRGLAEALGVSTYKFVYHFGTKDNLIRAAIRAAVQLRIEDVRSWLATGKYATVGSVMKRYWELFCRPENQGLTRLYFEVHGLALRNPEAYPDIIRSFQTQAMEFEKQIIATTGVPAGDVEALATLAVAGTWGMQLDLLSTGETARVTKAYHLLADSVDEQILRLQRQSSDG